MKVVDGSKENTPTSNIILTSHRRYKTIKTRIPILYIYIDCNNDLEKNKFSIIECYSLYFIVKLICLSSRIYSESIRIRKRNFQKLQSLYFFIENTCQYMNYEIIYRKGQYKLYSYCHSYEN
jgi:hypothetical protein